MNQQEIINNIKNTPRHVIGAFGGAIFGLAAVGIEALMRKENGNIPLDNIEVALRAGLIAITSGLGVWMTSGHLSNVSRGMASFVFRPTSSTVNHNEVLELVESVETPSSHVMGWARKSKYSFSGEQGEEPELISDHIELFIQETHTNIAQPNTLIYPHSVKDFMLANKANLRADAKKTMRGISAKESEDLYEPFAQSLITDYPDLPVNEISLLTHTGYMNITTNNLETCAYQLLGVDLYNKWVDGLTENEDYAQQFQEFYNAQFTSNQILSFE